MDDYLSRLKENVKTKKIEPAKKLLTQISSLPTAVKLDVLQILALAPDKTAFELLSFLTSKKHRDPEIQDRLIQLITDRAHLNFNFVLILFDNADPQTIIHAAALMRHILSNETQNKLLNRIISTAGKIKIKSLTDDIAEFIFYDDQDLKAEAVKALERIGTSRACEKLEQASKTSKCDQNILDAIQILKTNNLKKKISPDDPVVRGNQSQADLEQLDATDVVKRFKALVHLSEKESTVLSGLLKHLNTTDPKPDDTRHHDRVINILRLIERTIPLDAVSDLFAIINQKRIDTTIKFAAYNALEAFPKLDSAASVINGLSDPAMYVRLAAVRVLDKNPSDFVCAEVKNRIESGTKKGELLAQTILDARAKHLIEYLMVSDTFSYMASNYLAGAASIRVLDTFIEILKKRNLKSTARKYLDLKKTRLSTDREQCIVISSSKSILHIYRKLIYACGFSSLTFQKPQEAFEAFVFQKPCAIICDLFLNDMTGMDLAREARELYPKEDVPVILSSLQKNLNQDLLQKELADSGVNAIIEFPAKPGQIKSWLKFSS